MSLDLVAQEEKSDIKLVYQMIGKMVAKFGIKEIIAIYSPDVDEFALWKPENIKGLKSEDRLAVFDHTLQPTADPAVGCRLWSNTASRSSLLRPLMFSGFQRANSSASGL